jgi:hypothetical protein
MSDDHHKKQAALRSGFLFCLGGGSDVVARARSPNRSKAKHMWLDSNGTMKLKDIAVELDGSDLIS